MDRGKGREAEGQGEREVDSSSQSLLYIEKCSVVIVCPNYSR